jgi:hypothetical protein
MPTYRSRFPFLRIGPAAFRDGVLETDDQVLIDAVERSESFRCREVVRADAPEPSAAPPDGPVDTPAPPSTAVAGPPPAKSKPAMLAWLREHGVTVSDSLSRQQLVGVVEQVMRSETGGGDP